MHSAEEREIKSENVPDKQKEKQAKKKQKKKVMNLDEDKKKSYFIICRIIIKFIYSTSCIFSA